MKNKRLLLFILVVLFLYPITAFSGWTLHNNPPTTGVLYGIWGSSGSDVFAVGGGAILHYNGNSWAVISSDSAYPFDNAVWGSSSSDVFVSGNYQTGKPLV